MPVAETFDTDKDEETLLVFWCPGCEYLHQVRIEGPGDNWHWDGDTENPTLKPSVHTMPGSEAECHAFVRDGKIEFLLDSHHELAGETVELPELPYK